MRASLASLAVSFNQAVNECKGCGYMQTPLGLFKPVSALNSTGTTDRYHLQTDPDHNYSCVGCSTLLRGSQKDAAAATQVVSRVAASPKGREAVLAEGLVPALVGVLTTGLPAAQAAAADALTSIAIPSVVILDGGQTRLNMPGSGKVVGPANTAAAGSGAKTAPRSAGITGSKHAGREESEGQYNRNTAASSGRKVDPKVEVIRAGAMAPLVSLVRSSPHESCVVEACEALYCLAGCDAGKDAAVSAGARDALQEVVLKGKRKEVGDKAAKAAYDALMRLL